MNIYLVRHGETRKDPVFNVDGYPDAGLTNLGLEQAKLTAERLSSVLFDAIYSSDLKRAMQTAHIISGCQGNLPVEISRQIREIHMGVFHTSSEDQIRNEHPEFYEEFLKKETDFRYPEGESGEEVLTRTLAFLDSVKLRKLNDVCVVCHGGVIRSVVSHFLGLPQYKRFNLYPSNCGISLLCYDDENSDFRVISVNEILHMNQMDKELIRKI